ncbi:hypothetical protein C8R44DRAFT_593827, partial [Mycena epipterygia]
RLAPHNGRWITKTDAVKRYNLASSDLDSILPVTDQPNPRNSTGRMKTYNIVDVAALARRLQSTAPSASASSTSRLAPVNGRNIMRTTAMKEFGLKSCQMDRLKPVKETPNLHANAKGPTRWYNHCDEGELADSVTTAAASPT